MPKKSRFSEKRISLRNNRPTEKNMSLWKWCHFTALLVQLHIKSEFKAAHQLLVHSIHSRIFCTIPFTPFCLELELQSLDIRSDWLLIPQMGPATASQTNLHFLETSCYAFSQPRHVQVWQGWFWQDWRCKWTRVQPHPTKQSSPPGLLHL